MCKHGVQHSEVFTKDISMNELKYVFVWINDQQKAFMSLNSTVTCKICETKYHCTLIQHYNWHKYTLANQFNNYNFENENRYYLRQFNESLLE